MNQTQLPQDDVGQTPPVQPGATPQDQPKPKPAIPTPISVGHPEGGSFSSVDAKAPEKPVQTVESTPQLELKKEIMPGVHDVHHQSEPIKLPSQVEEVGVSSVPLPLGANTYKPPAMVLPLNQEEIKEGLHEPLRNSFRWLAEWCVKQLKEAHHGVKRKAKGKKH